MVEGKAVVSGSVVSSVISNMVNSPLESRKTQLEKAEH